MIRRRADRTRRRGAAAPAPIVAAPPEPAVAPAEPAPQPEQPGPDAAPAAPAAQQAVPTASPVYSNYPGWLFPSVLGAAAAGVVALIAARVWRSLSLRARLRRLAARE